MADLFAGVWEFVSSDKFDEYMQAVGVGTVMAKLGNTARPTLTITVEGDEWTIKSETTFKTTVTKFKLGVEFDEVTADDRHMKTTVTLDGNKLIQSQKGDIPSEIIREVNGTELTILCKAKDVVATRIYKKK